ncbi:MAG: hypothetical protein OEY11_01440 [Gammaproteobacteria bacterium]|nr:hypothetical protein [Gammaproteobacteria bacterium]
MADIFEMKRPLAINYSSGEKAIMVAYYPHKEGLVYLQPFWQQQAQSEQVTLIKGQLKGQGPWRIADAVITLVGCQGTDPELAQWLAEWECHVQAMGEQYYKAEDIRSLAREYGALV